MKRREPADKRSFTAPGCQRQERKRRWRCPPVTASEWEPSNATRDTEGPPVPLVLPSVSVRFCSNAVRYIKGFDVVELCGWWRLMKPTGRLDAAVCPVTHLLPVGAVWDLLCLGCFTPLLTEAELCVLVLSLRLH